MAKETGIQKALKKFGGSPTKLAAAIGGGATVTRQNVEHWLKSGRVSAERAPDVEAATGIPCELLCPGTNWSFLRNPSTTATEA